MTASATVADFFSLSAARKSMASKALRDLDQASEEVSMTVFEGGAEAEIALRLVCTFAACAERIVLLMAMVSFLEEMEEGAGALLAGTLSEDWSLFNWASRDVKSFSPSFKMSGHQRTVEAAESKK